jgi:competence protein ComEC
MGILILTCVRVAVLLSQPPTRAETHGVFQIMQIDKALGYYHSWQIRSQASRRRYRLRCFGECPQFRVGEIWRLSAQIKVSKHCGCYGLICQYRPLEPVLLLDKRADNKRLQLALSISQHARYVQLLQTWLSDPDTLAVFTALSLNDKRFFTSAIWRVFRRTGTSHLVAMSGLHVGLAVGLFALLAQRLLALLCPLWVSGYAARLRLLLVLGLATLLFHWVSLSYSVERALLMLLIAACCAAARGYLRLRSLLLLALLLLLLLDPRIVFSIGAWLSFFTVWTLVRHRTYEPDLNQLWVASPVRYIILFTSLIPMSLYFFHSVSLLSPLINWLVVPWFSLTVIPLLVLSLFISPLSVWLAKCLVWLAVGFFQPAYAALRWLSTLPHSQWCVSQLSLLSAGLLALLCEGGMWLIFKRSYGIMRGLSIATKRKNEYKQ